ncbi:MAG: MarR family transcriptional regulator [Clostridiales bacterium]|nr:MarR family transcriptional regulator [Clostridiales bacterium]
MKYDYHEAMKLKNQLCFPLYAASRNVIGLYTPYLNELGLTYTQYLVFLVLWEKDGITVSEICEKLKLDSGTVSPLLKKLQQAGYIRKVRSAGDDRVVEITLTEAGKALQKKAKDVPLKVSSCLDLSPEKAKMLYDLLYELLENQNRKNAKGESV